MPVINTEVIDPTSDITTTTTLLHETIPITGTIASGTYDDNNIKNYTHGMFQSVYDYPYLSSSSNHIFDLTIGYDSTSALSASTGTGVVQRSKKINLYNQYAQVLLGYTASNADNLQKFESDLNLDGSGVIKDAFFVSFSRLLTKDEIKRGNFTLTVGTGNWATPFSGELTLTDASASVSGDGIKNVVGGNYGLLYDSAADDVAKGVIFYEAGIVVLSSSIFADVSAGEFNKLAGASYSVEESMISASISGSCSAFRHRLQNISFNNTTEINSKIYFCRVNHNDFNYSANPTYVENSKVRVKNVAGDQPISYITTVGLYNAAGEMLAVAKLSEPLRKDPNNDLTIRVRLDY
jgi:hypothetical protein|tara:strand:- start:1386 stop:2438 length:1053 start_codon:yes stop_codon:yes gene_type:complete